MEAVSQEVQAINIQENKIDKLKKDLESVKKRELELKKELVSEYRKSFPTIFIISITSSSLGELDYNTGCFSSEEKAFKTLGKKNRIQGHSYKIIPVSAKSISDNEILYLDDEKHAMFPQFNL